MSLPAWPAVPYQPDPASWKRAPLLPPIRTEMDGGNVRQRRRPGDNVSIISQTVVMTKDDFATLEAWVAASIGSGVARFTMNVFLGNATGYVSKTVQFEPNGQDFPYSVSWFGVTHRAVGMTLRVFGV